MKKTRGIGFITVIRLIMWWQRDILWSNYVQFHCLVYDLSSDIFVHMYTKMSQAHFFLSRRITNLNPFLPILIPRHPLTRLWDQLVGILVSTSFSPMGVLLKGSKGQNKRIKWNMIIALNKCISLIWYLGRHLKFEHIKSLPNRLIC